MSRNDQILTEQIIQQEFNKSTEFNNEDKFFEVFSASLILKGYDLSYDQIEEGLCGNSLDGGADSIYLMINGDLISEDTNIEEKYKRNVDIELFIIQSKNERSFGEDAILKLNKLSTNLLNLDFNAEEYKLRYNETVLNKFDNFRKNYLSLITKRPKLTIKYFYITKGIEIHPNVNHQALELKNDVSNILTDATIEFNMIGASEIMDIYRQRDNEVFNLKLLETPLSSQGKVFISLVKLKDYFDFITDENDNIIKHIFEANVRDYQGKTSVNQEIKDTLEDVEPQEDFWWLNNGVTILADDVSAPGGKELIIHNPEIVNGLQTSNEIYRYFSSLKDHNNTRSILVRVIVPETEESRDKIIRATNSQTPIPKASLRATDSIHRDIEDYLKPRGLFYDRRKNYYKNEGKKPTEIVGLSFLAQCLMAITMQKPDFARARPSTLLEEDSSYEKLYNHSNNIKSYYIAALIGKKIELYLKKECDFTVNDKNNIKFYLAYVVAVRITSNKFPGFKSLENIEPSKINNECIKSSLIFVENIYNAMGGGDKLAKGQSMIKRIKAELDNFI
ncbi:AIPR family protein [Leclercia sp.]|uniref:AIPR family protein n=1 Tax=Leclercia sp. TaxID=1898428 RepID=UPI00289DDAF8|nr:AIPR family protein [Leclercia sp.]